MSTWRATVEILSPDFGGVGTNTWHFRTSGPIPGAEADANGLMGALEDFYTACASQFPDNTQYVFNGEISGVLAEEGETRTIDSWALSGATAGDNLPPANCVVIGWRTGSGGRMGKGRTFLGPMIINSVASDGTPSATTLSTLNAAAAALVDFSEGFDNGAFGVLSGGRPASGGDPAVPPLFRDFIDHRINNQFAVLRSRRD